MVEGWWRCDRDVVEGGKISYLDLLSDHKYIHAVSFLRVMGV